MVGPRHPAYPHAGQVVAVVDDVATTGGSLLQAADAAEAFGCKVALALAVLDRDEGAAEALKARGIEFAPLLTAHDMFDVVT
jgi:orotate phosphoribosyltransferase